MHRFYTPSEICAPDTIELEGQEAHHALHVLRSRPGDIVTLLDGVGTALTCRVGQATGKNRLRLEVVERRTTAPPACRVTLYQAIPKGKTLENIIHKATELGVARIVPLISERVISRPGEEGASKKAEKWHLTAVEAIKQCGQPWLPQVDAPRSFTEVLEGREPSELELIGSLLPGSKHPRRFFLDFETSRLRKPVSVGVWIGPEGDFTTAEVGAVVGSGACPVTLGPLVLKCETAAIYVLSVVNYEVQAGLS